MGTGRMVTEQWTTGVQFLVLLTIALRLSYLASVDSNGLIKAVEYLTVD